MKYTIIRVGSKLGTKTGTLSELVELFQTTLRSGKVLEDEYGSSKIDIKPTSIKKLITNINNSKKNMRSTARFELV